MYFPTITKEFVSPLGNAGAYYGMAVFSLAIASIAGFQKKQISISTFSGLIVVATAYYYWAVEKRQVFSEEEKKVMFKAYLLKGKASRRTLTLSWYKYANLSTFEHFSAFPPFSGNKSKANRIKKGPRSAAGRGARAEHPTPRSDNGKKEKDKEVSITRVYAAVHTDPCTSPSAAYLSDEEQPPLARRGDADKDQDQDQEETTYHLAGRGAAEGVVTVWEKDREEYENEEEVECAHEEVPELPV
jgi:hypothetical protein